MDDFQLFGLSNWVDAMTFIELQVLLKPREEQVWGEGKHKTRMWFEGFRHVNLGFQEQVLGRQQGVGLNLSGEVRTEDVLSGLILLRDMEVTKTTQRESMRREGKRAENYLPKDLGLLREVEKEQQQGKPSECRVLKIKEGKCFKKRRGGQPWQLS